MARWASGLRPLVQQIGVTRAITVACVILYVASVLLDPGSASRGLGGTLEFLTPSWGALDELGMTGVRQWAEGRWWTLLTATYLHGGVLHLLFNLVLLRHIGEAVEAAFGPARFFVIFSAAGAVGFAVSNLAGVPSTIGASGAVFGLLGAMVAYGWQRGGTFGSAVLKQYGQWALIFFAFGVLSDLLLEGVNNWAHGGGFVGGLACAALLASGERRPESSADYVFCCAVAVLTIVGFGLAVYHGLIAG